MLSIKTILHPTDFSEPADAAFQCAYSLATDYHAQLVIVHVISVPLMFGEWLRLSNTLECPEKREENLFELKVVDKQVDMVGRLEQARPAAEILQLAQLCRADLIVMGAHGRRGLNQFLMGSVVDEVVRLAPCPVVTVRVPENQGTTPLDDHVNSTVL